MNVAVNASFIDYHKAFDMINHDKLLKILKSTSIDDRNVRLISELYWNQKTTIRLQDLVSETVNIKIGVRQGCVLSPLLFNIYA